MNDTPSAESIFFDALEVTTPDERVAYLNQICGDDLKLRTEVERLLAAHGDIGNFLSWAGVSDKLAETQSQVPVEGTILQDCSITPNPSNEGIGTVVAGRYVLQTLLGEGGMGSVYLAQQTEPIRRTVAVKLIKTGMDSKQVLARFDAERQALALMDHPNIARVFDGGMTSSGQPFFVMEVVCGEPITTYCDQHRLTPKARLELFVQVCQAVQHAHQKGIIHRDLKPGNVLVTNVDGRPVPKVIDFGVAKATEQRLTDQSYADTGIVVGTPAYMSPEQADPTSMDIDTRTDVYALGVMLYELLAGSPPIDANQFRRGALLEMLRMVRDVEPPKPSTKASSAEALPNIAANRNLEPNQLLKWLRGDIDWIVMKALEKDRDRRYESALGFATDLQRHLANEPVLARPPSRGYRLRKFVRRNRGAVTAASLVLVALLVGIVTTTWQAIEATQARGKAEQEATNARLAETKAQEGEQRESEARKDADLQKGLAFKQREEAVQQRAKAEQILDFFNRVLDQTEVEDQHAPTPKTDISLKEAVDNVCRLLESLKLQPLVQAEIHRTASRAYIGVGALAEAETQGRKSIALYEQHLGPDEYDTLVAVGNLSRVLDDRGKFEEAEKFALRASDGIRKIRPADDQAVLTTRRVLADIYERNARHEQAVKIYLEVYEVLNTDKSYGPIFVDTFSTMNNLAMCYANWEKWDLAEHWLLELQKRNETMVKPPDVLWRMRISENLGWIYREQRMFQKAEPIFVRVLADRLRILGPTNALTLNTAMNLAAVYLHGGHPEKVRPLLESVVKRWQEAGGTMSHYASQIVCLVGQEYSAVGDWVPAQKWFELALPWCEKTYGMNNTYTRIIYGNMALCLQYRKLYAEAESYYLRALAGPETKKAGAPEPLRGNFARMYQEWGKHDKAIPILKDLLEERLKSDPDAWTTANSQARLGESYLGNKEFAKAEQYLLAGYTGLKKNEAKLPPVRHARLPETAKLLVELYTTQSRGNEANRWKTELAEYPTLGPTPREVK